VTTDERQRIIETMVSRIVERFHPDQIVLFGSYARGDQSPDSDVDLLVVKTIEGPKRQERLAIRAALRGCGLPKDIVVVTPDEVTRFRHTAGSLIRAAMEEGRVLYDAAA
jgi:predicted nucleotidyltransferase